MAESWRERANRFSHDEEEAIEERLVSQLVDDRFDWVSLVRRYPVPALIASATFGFVVGRNHGTSLLSLATDSLAERVGEAVTGFDRGSR